MVTGYSFKEKKVKVKMLKGKVFPCAGEIDVNNQQLKVAYHFIVSSCESNL